MITNKFSRISFPFFGLLKVPYEINITFNKIQIKRKRFSQLETIDDKSLAGDYFARLMQLDKRGDFNVTCKNVQDCLVSKVVWGLDKNAIIHDLRKKNIDGKYRYVYIVGSKREKKDIREIINKEYKRNGMANLTKDEIKYVDKSLIKPVKIFDSLDPTTYLSNAEQRRAVLTPKKFTDKPQYPEVVVDHIRLLEPKDTKQEAREAAQERLREFAFRKTPDPDAVKGIGSFKDVIGKN